jgi:putative endonuclease
MSKSKKLGIEGEQAASDYLEKNKWTILENNYRFRHSEIDLIAKKGGFVVFFEVKTRTDTSFGMPEDFVDEKKAEFIMRAANQYIEQTGWHGNIRFDIIAIVKGTQMELTHIEDAF